MKTIVPLPLPLALLKCSLQSLSCGMRMVMALARSRASFFTSCNSLRSCLGVLDLGDDLLGDLLVAVEEVQQLLAHPVHQLGADFRVAQLVLGLRLEHRVLQPDGHRADHALAHVVAVELLVARIR